VLHHVKYSIWADTPGERRDLLPGTPTRPPLPITATTRTNTVRTSKADVGPDKQWILDVMLADPNQWAMVIGTVPRPKTVYGFFTAYWLLTGRWWS